MTNYKKKQIKVSSVRTRVSVSEQAVLTVIVSCLVLLAASLTVQYVLSIVKANHKGRKQ